MTPLSKRDRSVMLRPVPWWRWITRSRMFWYRIGYSDGQRDLMASSVVAGLERAGAFREPLR